MTKCPFCGLPMSFSRAISATTVEWACDGPNAYTARQGCQTTVERALKNHPIPRVRPPKRRVSTRPPGAPPPRFGIRWTRPPRGRKKDPDPEGERSIRLR